MKTEKPILFSTEMVKAILAGRKLMTRRLQGLEKINENPDGYYFQSLVLHASGKFTFGAKNPDGIPINDLIVECKPRYKSGDILWVRESFCLTQPFDPETYHFGYKCGVQPYSSKPASEKYDFSTPDKWKPSIHMPREAARIFLKVTNVRVERLQDISEADAIAEGIECEYHDGKNIYYFYPCNDLRDDSYLEYPITSFYSLWNSINGHESWNKNPWVFVYEFEILKK